MGDFIFSVYQIDSFFLLLFPLYVFLQQYDFRIVLFSGGFSALLLELLNGYLLGSFMIGVGLGFLFFQRFLDILNWNHPLTQVISLFLFLFIVVMTRSILVWILDGLWSIVRVQPFLMTFLMGCIYIFYRFIQTDDTRESI